MPPKRCPECGRFLANDLVSSLGEAPAPCPRCGVELHPDTIVGGERERRGRSARPAAPPAADATDRAAQPVEPAGSATVAREDRTPQASPPTSDVEPPAPTPDPEGPPADSIRPPDLDPEAVRTTDEDVLAGWDLGATGDEIASWRVDERPFPTDAVLVGGATVLGGLLGGLLPEQHRGRWAAVGGLAGAVGAGALRRIWELRG